MEERPKTVLLTLEGRALGHLPLPFLPLLFPSFPCTCARAPKTPHNPNPCRIVYINMLKWLLILPIRIYQVTLSPLLGPNKCRYQPTCSHYAIEAIEEWGILKGSWLAAKRIGSCHPWGGFGPDPVPKKPKPDPAKDAHSH